MNTFLFFFFLSIAALGAISFCLLRVGFGKLFFKITGRKIFFKDPDLESILQDEGYTLLKRQHSHKCCVSVNGEKMPYELIPEAFAVKEKKRFLVHSKKEHCGFESNVEALRQYYLEYYFSFHVDGILLVNPDTRKIYSIYFVNKGIRGSSSILPLIIAFCLGVIFALTIMERQ